MTKIFISYRRQDTLPIAGRIYDRLSSKFGAERVFMDIDSIPFGVDFHGWLDGEVSKASIVLALIGAGWIDARDETGERRLDNPDDFVRIEIESALRRDIPLVPVLIGGAQMPKAGELPDTLRSLARRNAAFVDMARDFHMHMDRLIAGLEWHLNGQPSTTAGSRPDSPVQSTTSQERGKAQLITPGSGESFRDAPFAPEMVVVPAGEFRMGSTQSEIDALVKESNSDWYRKEGPQHKVIISKPFAIGVCPVTFAEWDAAQADNDWQRITGIEPRKPKDFGWDRGDRPVIDVSWDDAQAYVKWLSEKTGKDYCLPTEAQWEYACRAGTATPFWWGSSINTNQANYNGNPPLSGGKKGEYRNKTLPVKSFQPNPWGLYQVHGNVWEWCADDLRPYSVDTVTDPVGHGSNRALRGGSWGNIARDVRAASRLAGARGGRFSYVGFRCARVRK